MSFKRSFIAPKKMTKKLKTSDGDYSFNDNHDCQPIDDNNLKSNQIVNSIVSIEDDVNYNNTNSKSILNNKTLIDSEPIAHGISSNLKRNYDGDMIKVKALSSDSPINCNVNLSHMQKFNKVSELKESNCDNNFVHIKEEKITSDYNSNDLPDQNLCDFLLLDSFEAKENNCEPDLLTSATSHNTLLIEKNKLDYEIRKKEEILRKLNLVKMYQTKEDFMNMEELTRKWKNCIHKVLADLMDGLPQPKPSIAEYLRHSQIDARFIGYNEDDDTFE